MITFIQYYGKSEIMRQKTDQRLAGAGTREGLIPKGAPNGFLSDDGLVLNLDMMNTPVSTQTKHQK